MSKYFRRRMEYSLRLLEEKLKTKFPSIAKYGLIGGGILFVISWIISATADEVAAKIGIQIWSILKSVSNWIINFASSHLVTTALIALILWIGILFTKVYLETRPLHDIFFHPTEPRHNGIFYWSGFEVENRRGENLGLVWLADKNSGKRLHWGKEDRGSNYKDIVNGDKELMEWLCFNSETKESFLRPPGTNIPIPIGTHEIELEFGATPKGQHTALPIRPLFVTVKATEKNIKVISAKW